MTTTENVPTYGGEHQQVIVQDHLPNPIISGLPSQQELMVYQTWAKNAADSQMYRNVGKESGIMMIMLAAREYGIGPAQALNGGLHIIEGKVELSARMMSALIRRAKHVLKIIESSDEKCMISGRRSDTHETYTATYTMEDAQKAGLVKDKGGWKRTPSDMLYARTLSRLARRLFSDVIGIGYIEGEIIDSGGVSVENSPVAESQSSQLEAQSCIDRILSHCELEDRPLMVNFAHDLGKHNQWSPEYTHSVLLQDLEKTMQRFKNYKEKLNEKIVHRISPVVGDDNVN